MISLFSGIGAFEVAAKRVFNEINIKAAAEIDKYARLSYLANHKIKEESFHKDIYSFDATLYKGEVDIVVGGSPCFVEGTLIYTKMGFKPIEKIVVGDEVLTHTNTFKKVLKIGSNKNKETIILSAKGIKDTECTPDHPYYVRKIKDNKITEAKWIPISKVDIGDYIGIPLILFQDNIKYYDCFIKEKTAWIEISAINKGRKSQTVYNIEVEEDNSYTANNAIVHNCQDFSIAGLRAGVLGQKGQLIWEYYRIIQETMPPYFIYENVKGMKSDRNGETLREFLEVFKELGYYCHWQVLNTKHYGIPQNRERIFIVGFLDKEIYNKFTFPEKIELKKAIKDLLEDNVPQKYYLSKRFIAGMEERNEMHKKKGNGFNFNPKMHEEITAINCLTTKYGGRASDTFLKEPKLIQAGTLDIRGNDSIKRVYDINGIYPCLTTMGGGLREPKILESIIYDDYNSKIKEDGIAPCLTTNCGASAARNGQKVIEIVSENKSIDIDSIIDYRIRKLTPKECLRFQDFPDSFEENCRKINISDTQLYKQAGNSISANVLEMIFIQLKEAINEK